VAQRGRRGLSAAGKKEMWRRWREGQWLSEIGRALGNGVGSIYGTIRIRGRFSPPERKRSRLALTVSEREEISRGVAGGEPACAIARIPAVRLSLAKAACRRPASANVA